MATASPLRRFLSITALLVAACALFVTRPRFTLDDAERGTDEKTSSCLSNLRQIARAYSLYARDFDGKIPRGVDPEDRNGEASPFFNSKIQTPYLHEILRPYVASREVFRCPADRGWTKTRLSDNPKALKNVRPSSFSRFGTSYYCWTLYGFEQFSAVDLPQPEQTVLLFDGDLWHGKSPGDRLNALFADGHVETLSPQQFERSAPTR